MKTQNPTSPDRAHLIELNGAYEQLGADIEQVRARIESLRGNRATLEQRLAQTNDQQPTEDCELDDPLVAALAADPAADLSSREVSVAAERSASIQSAMRAWRKEVSLVERAIGKVDETIGAAEAELVSLRHAHKEAHAAFAKAAYDYLLSEFRERFEVLYSEVLAPMAAIEKLKGPDEREVVPVYAGFCRDLEIKRRLYERGGFTDEHFFPKMVRVEGKSVDATSPADLERFRLSIGTASA
jgi:predicted  nucleic acid-binding Zn-ribbon protein